MNAVDALLAAPLPLIMEVKRRAPDGTDLLGGRPVAEVVAGYEAAGAPWLSVVTGRWFGGRPEDLREVAALTDRPLLQKDFLTRRDQLRTAADHGAAAVLLTAALLPASGMATLVAAALDLGLVPFVEVTTATEVAAVPRASECVIAVNNKDITDRERGPADVARSHDLLPALWASGTRCPVSASGIDRPEVAAGLLDAGFAALLVGTSLLRRANGDSGADGDSGTNGNGGADGGSGARAWADAVAAARRVRS